MWTFHRCSAWDVSGEYTVIRKIDLLVFLVLVSTTLINPPRSFSQQGGTGELIGQLGSPSFKEREKATKVLIDRGESVLESLRKAEEGSSDLEVRRRVRTIIRAIKSHLYKELRVFLGHKERVCSCAFSPDSKRIISGGGDGTVRVWDRESGKELETYKVDALVSVVAPSPEGSRLLVGDCDGYIRILERGTGKTLLRVKGNEEQIGSAAFAIGGSFVVCGGAGAGVKNDFSLRLIDCANGITSILSGHSHGIFSVSVACKGRTAISGSRDQSVIIWDLDKRKEIGRFLRHDEPVTSVAISADGLFALSGDYFGRILLWKVKSQEVICELKGHWEAITDLKISPDGRFGLSASGYPDLGSLNRFVNKPRDYSVRLWDLKSGREEARFTGHSKRVTCVAFSPDGRFCLSGSCDETLRLWRISGSQANER